MGAMAYPEIDCPAHLMFYKENVILAGAIPVVADVTAEDWIAGDRGMGIGTDGSTWWMYYDGTNLEAGELSA